MLAGNNRHFGDDIIPHREPFDDKYPLPKWVHECKRRRVKLKDLVLEVVVSPWADDETWEDVSVWAKVAGFPMRRSSLEGKLTPTVKEWDRLHPSPKALPAKGCK
jgi:hypothetical protein